MSDIVGTLAYAAWFVALRGRTAKPPIEARSGGSPWGNSGDIQPAGEGVSEMRIHYGPGWRIDLTKQ